MKKVAISIFAVLVILAIVCGVMYVIDMNQMKSNKPVVFSTWGYDYIPPINLDEEKISEVVHDYVMFNNEIKSSGHENQKWFVSIKTYLIKEKEDAKTIVYAWVLEKNYYNHNNEIVLDSSSSIPYKFTLQKSDKGYSIINCEKPRDGNYYEQDMKKMFPQNVLDSMQKIYTDGTIEALEASINEQVKQYFDNDEKNNKSRLTLQSIIDMVANKGANLTWNDFEKYESKEVGSGLYILSYEIDDKYRLMIGGVPSVKPMYIKLVSIKDEEKSIDIRYDSIEEFLNTTN